MQAQGKQREEWAAACDEDDQSESAEHKAKPRPLHLVHTFLKVGSGKGSTLLDVGSYHGAHTDPKSLPTVAESAHQIILDV